MMLDWVKKNQKLAFKVTGVNFLLMALVLLFWSQPKMVLSENEKAAANVARMESKAKGNSAPSSTGNIMQEHHQSQKKQLRIFLIIMTISGAVLLGYGFLKKE
jgi:Na+/H+ antiporter NhaC